MQGREEDGGVGGPGGGGGGEDEGRRGGGYLSELVLTPFTVQRLRLGSAEERSAARVERTVLAVKRRRGMRRLRSRDSEEDSLSTSGVESRRQTQSTMLLKCNTGDALSFCHNSAPRLVVSH